MSDENTNNETTNDNSKEGLNTEALLINIKKHIQDIQDACDAYVKVLTGGNPLGESGMVEGPRHITEEEYERIQRGDGTSNKKCNKIKHILFNIALILFGLGIIVCLVIAAAAA